MKIAFLMDHLTSIDPTNETTSHIMYECNQRGHTVYFLAPAPASIPPVMQ